MVRTVLLKIISSTDDGWCTKGRAKKQQAAGILFRGKIKMFWKHDETSRLLLESLITTLWSPPPPTFPLQCTLAIAVVMCRDHVLIALMLSKRILNGLCASKLCNLTLHLLVCRCSGLAHKSHMRETRPKKVSLARSDKTRPRGGGLTHKREALILIFRFYSLHIFFLISSISIYDTRAVLKTRSFADSLPWDGRSSYF